MFSYDFVVGVWSRCFCVKRIFLLNPEQILSYGGFLLFALTDRGSDNPSALTSSVICPPNVTHVPTETWNGGGGVRKYTNTHAHPVKWLHIGTCDSACARNCIFSFELTTSAFSRNGKMYSTILSTQFSSQIFYKVVWMQQMWSLPNPRQDTRRPDFPRFLSTQRIALALKQWGLRVFFPPNLPAFDTTMKERS